MGEEVFRFNVGLEGCGGDRLFSDNLLAAGG